MHFFSGKGLSVQYACVLNKYSIVCAIDMFAYNLHLHASLVFIIFKNKWHLKTRFCSVVNCNLIVM